MSSTTAATFTYCIDTYGPNPDAPSTNLIVPGPAGLSRSAALDYLTGRLRDMAGGPSVAPPEGWSEWGPFAASVLDQAEANPTVGQSAKATDRDGVWVTAYGGSELPKRNPDDARALLVDGLTDLLAAHGGRLDAVRPLIGPALTMAISHYESEHGGATVSGDQVAEPTTTPADFTLTIGLGNAAMQTPEHVAGALRDAAEKVEQHSATAGVVVDGNGNSVGEFVSPGLEQHHRDRHDLQRIASADEDDLPELLAEFGPARLEELEINEGQTDPAEAQREACDLLADA